MSKDASSAILNTLAQALDIQKENLKYAAVIGGSAIMGSALGKNGVLAFAAFAVIACGAHANLPFPYSIQATAGAS